MNCSHGYNDIEFNRMQNNMCFRICLLHAELNYWIEPTCLS